MALRVKERIEEIIQDAMLRLRACKVSLSTLQSNTLWKESQRYNVLKDTVRSVINLVRFMKLVKRGI